MVEATVCKTVISRFDSYPVDKFLRELTYY